MNILNVHIKRGSNSLNLAKTESYLAQMSKDAQPGCCSVYGPLMWSQVDCDSILAPSPTGYLSILIFLSLGFLINKTVINRTCKTFARIKYNIGETFMTQLGTGEFLLFSSYNYHIMIILGGIIQTQLPVLSQLAAHTLKSYSSNQKGTLMMVPLCTYSIEIHYVHLIIHS